ncbi:hypothetical protein [Streptomyces sp. NPDC055099]
MGSEDQTKDEANEAPHNDGAEADTSNNEARENAGSTGDGAKDEDQGVQDQIEGGHPESGQ